MTQLSQFLLLARISNLPTIWSNVLAAMALTGHMDLRTAAIAIPAMSALYTAGMFLNDAFDKDFDAKSRPERPLPSGRVSTSQVWAIGFTLLIVGVALIAMCNADAGILSMALAGTILLYDAWHKNNPVAPFLMGSCRGLVYLTTAAATGAALSSNIALAAIALATYVAGLTFVAREEHLERIASWWPLPLILLAPAVAFSFNPSVAMALACLLVLAVLSLAIRPLLRRQGGDVKIAVSLLIAGIALIDMLFALATGHPVVAAACLAAFLATQTLQRFVPGT